MSSATIRPLRHADLEQIQAVALAAWRWTYHDIFAADFIDEFVRANCAPEPVWRSVTLLGSDGHFDVAEAEGEVVGFCQIGLLPTGARLFRIYLLPALIGQGIGAALLGSGEAWLRAKHVAEYGCYVHAANQVGLRFYERQQFQRVPERDNGDEWYMQKRL